MSWLRVDDRFADHPKIGALTDREFRIWVRTLCYCARYRDPTVDAATIAGVSGLDSKKVGRFLEVELLDQTGDSLVIHDWNEYAPKDPSGADRQAKWRAARNGRVTDTVTEEVTAPDRYETVSRAQERAGVSVPSRKDQDPVTPTVLQDDGSGPGEIDLNRVNQLLAQAAIEDMPA